MWSIGVGAAITSERVGEAFPTTELHALMLLITHPFAFVRCWPRLCKKPANDRGFIMCAVRTVES